MNTARLASAAALSLALVGCEDSTAPLPTSGVPAMLEFSLGGYFVGSKSVILRGDTVLYVRVPWDHTPTVKLDTVRTVPSAEQWRAFWSAAQGAGVSRWRPEYVAEGIVDGVGWGLRLAANGRIISSQGSNAFPDGDGRKHEGDSTPEFQVLLHAFNDLIGQTVF